MANSTDFGGNGATHLKARNEHKATEKVDKESVTASRTHTREKGSKRATGSEISGHSGGAFVSIAAAPPRGPTRSTPSSTSAARAPSRTPTAASSSRWRAPRSRRAGASSRPTSSSRSTSARPACTATRTPARRASARSSIASRTPSASAGDRGYFATKADADTFEAELSYLLVNQYGAFNSPVWFNLGLWHEYEIAGSGGNWAWDEATGRPSPRRRPPTSARSARRASSRRSKDDLMSIYDLVKAEARLFKYGSGTGSNFSAIRGRQEKLSGGGTSSGLMSFLEVFDRAAGATKSGGTTRRAAKMVCLDMDHPEIARLHRLEGARGEEGPRAHRRRATAPTSTARRTTPSAGRTRTTASA